MAVDLKDIDPKSQPARQNEVTFDLKSRPRSGIAKSAPCLEDQKIGYA
ncbi:hypothetical protein [Duffyella gerundensis]